MDSAESEAIQSMLALSVCDGCNGSIVQENDAQMESSNDVLLHHALQTSTGSAEQESENSVWTEHIFQDSLERNYVELIRLLSQQESKETFDEQKWSQKTLHSCENASRSADIGFLQKHAVITVGHHSEAMRKPFQNQHHILLTTNLAQAVDIKSCCVSACEKVSPGFAVDKSMSPSFTDPFERRQTGEVAGACTSYAAISTANNSCEGTCSHQKASRLEAHEHVQCRTQTNSDHCSANKIPQYLSAFRAQEKRSKELESNISKQQRLRQERRKLLKHMFHRTELTEKGCLQCRLCQDMLWAPNARYHLDSCEKLVQERKQAIRNGHTLKSICGVTISDEQVFSKPATPSCRAAKVEGFVMSPAGAATSHDNDGAATKITKGYVRCLVCEQEVWAPNSSRHRSRCILREELVEDCSIDKTPLTSASTQTVNEEQLHCLETLDLHDIQQYFQEIF